MPMEGTARASGVSYQKAELVSAEQGGWIWIFHYSTKKAIRFVELPLRLTRDMFTAHQQATVIHDIEKPRRRRARDFRTREAVLR